MHSVGRTDGELEREHARDGGVKRHLEQETERARIVLDGVHLQPSQFAADCQSRLRTSLCVLDHEHGHARLDEVGRERRERGRGARGRRRDEHLLEPSADRDLASDAIPGTVSAITVYEMHASESRVYQNSTARPEIAARIKLDPARWGPNFELARVSTSWTREGYLRDGPARSGGSERSARVRRGVRFDDEDRDKPVEHESVVDADTATGGEVARDERRR